MLLKEKYDGLGDFEKLNGRFIADRSHVLKRRRIMLVGLRSTWRNRLGGWRDECIPNKMRKETFVGTCHLLLLCLGR
jgi:hypothetical protein